MTFPVPRNLADAARVDGRLRWLAGLPARVADLGGRWGLTLGDPFEPGGHSAWVAPARDEAGADLVLKVGWWHYEATHEAEGLREWAGDGAVTLHRAERTDDTVALLVERCHPGTALADRPEEEQDEVVAGLLRRLWREPGPGAPFRPLREMCDAWADEFADEAAEEPPDLDPGLVRAGIALFRELPRTAERHALLCTDLHAENVLAAGREPWLVVDPKPYVGDPTYDLLQHMLNCEASLHADPRALVRRLAGLAGVDPDRLALWLFARCVQESPGNPAMAAVARRLAPP